MHDNDIEENPAQTEKTIAGTAITLIAYDLHDPKGALHDRLVEKIMSLGSWWHHLETVWIVKGVHGPGHIRDHLQLHIGSDDQLLVIDITGDVAAAAGVNDAGTAWLRQTLGAGSQ